MSSRVPAMPPEMLALIGAAVTALGGLPTLAEAEMIGAGEPICSIDSNGAIRVHLKIKQMRQRAMRKASRRPPLRRSAPRLSGQPRTRAPRRPRRSAAAAVRAADDGGDGDADPEPRPLTAVPKIQPRNAAPAATGKVRL